MAIGGNSSNIVKGMGKTQLEACAEILPMVDGVPASHVPSRWTCHGLCKSHLRLLSVL
jgi:hypothetical protein